MNPELPQSQFEHPEWEEKSQDISNCLIELRRRYPGAEGFGKREQIQQRIIAFARNLQSKYPDYSRYRLYHGFIGSTPSQPSLYLDFPGEDSVELFIRKLEEEFGEQS